MSPGSAQDNAADEPDGAAGLEGVAEPDVMADPEGAGEPDGADGRTASAMGSSVEPARLTTTQEAATMTTTAATAMPMIRCRRLRA